MIRAVIFDLDDTLYRELDFVASGYRAVAAFVSERCGLPCAQIENFMMELLARAGRRAVMPAVVERFPGFSCDIAELVDVYRGHTPAIRLYPGYAELLGELRRTCRLGIVTDGTPEVQERKCVALGLEDAVDCILYTWQYGRDKEKPHPQPFHKMLSYLNVGPAEAIFVGDSVEKDCRGARGVGMKSALVCTQPVSCAALITGQADFVIDSLFQIPLVLKQLGGPE
jgi:putative hydrolase of the HAD superfamily